MNWVKLGLVSTGKNAYCNLLKFCSVGRLIFHTNIIRFNNLKPNLNLRDKRKHFYSRSIRNWPGNTMK